MSVEIKTTIKLGKFLGKDKYPEHVLDTAISAAIYIVEEEYVDETPVDIGNPGFKGGIQATKVKPLEYYVESTATTDGGIDYPLALYYGTGKLKGMPDFGFTTGRVRANEVAWGIGGIRPNKVADRAKEDSEKPFLDFIHKFVLKRLDD